MYLVNYQLKQEKSWCISIKMDSSNNKSDPPDLYQISLLIDQLRHDDAQMRISATKHLGSIGKYL